MAKKILSLILCLILILTMLCACKNKTADIIKYPVKKDSTCLDPQIAVGETSNIVICNCFEGLVRMGKGERIIPGVASSWKVSGDKLTYTFKLRKDTNWHLQKGLEDLLGKDYDKKFDTSIKAQDFVFGITRALDPQTNSPNAHKLFSIKNGQKFNKGKASKNDLGINAINDYTLEITLDYPSVNFLYNLAQPVAMPCNKEFFEKTSGKYGRSASLLLCNGPFFLRRWEPNTFISLFRNENYKGEEDVLPAGVKFEINPDTSTYINKIVSGSYDVTPITKSDLKNIPKEEKISTLKFKNKVWSLFINKKNIDIMNNDLSLALKYSTNSGLLNLSSEKKAQGIVPSSCLLMFGAPYRAQAQSVISNNYNGDLAQEYWNKYIEGGNSSEISISLLCLKEHQSIIKKLVQDWQKTFGIDFSISILTMEPDELQKRVKEGNYEIAFAPIVSDDILVEDFLYQFKTDNQQNLLNYSSSKFDNLLEEIRESKSQNQLLKSCTQAENELISSGSVFPAFNEENYLISKENLKGLYIYPTGNNISFINAQK